MLALENPFFAHCEGIWGSEGIAYWFVAHALDGCMWSSSKPGKQDVWLPELVWTSWESTKILDTSGIWAMTHWLSSGQYTDNDTLTPINNWQVILDIWNFLLEYWNSVLCSESLFYQIHFIKYIVGDQLSLLFCSWQYDIRKSPSLILFSLILFNVKKKTW